MSIADGYDAFLIDLDGVIWRGRKPIEGAANAIAKLRAAGKRVVFVTNASAPPQREFVVRLFQAGIPAEPTDIVTSSHATSRQLEMSGASVGDKVFVLGGPGLRQVLRSDGYSITNDASAATVVVVGLDPKVTYDKIAAAANAAENSLFIATNTDPRLLVESGYVPGAGAIVAAVEAASGKQAIVAGKPSAAIFDIACERASTKPAATLVVGDSITTDLAGATNAKMRCALVLTGVTSESDLGALKTAPDEIIDSLEDLFAPRQEVEIKATRDGTVVKIASASAPRGRNGWLALRKELVHLVAGATSVEAPPDVAEYLASIGVDVSPQQKLFS